MPRPISNALADSPSARSADPLIEGAGTTESEWRSWGVLDALPTLDLAGCASMLVVAPHPDDEVLGVGGISAILEARGCGHRVLALSDGEASHPRSPIDSKALGARRVAETIAALELMVDTDARIDYLRIPDGVLRHHEGQIEFEIAARLEHNSWCFAPFRGDGHPDHEAAGRAAQRACASVGARLVEYPIWMWHWASPADERVPWPRARSVDLPWAIRMRKHDAIRTFRSQIETLLGDPSGEVILPPEILARFLRSFEVVFV